MKKLQSVKIIFAVFVMVMAFFITGSTSQAATKSDKLTLYVGEQLGYSYIGMGTLKSAKSSNKKVVTASKKNGSCIMKAEKTGKATVTAKGSKGTWKHNITVKKADFQVDIVPIAGTRYGQVSVKNNTSGFFTSFDVLVTFNDANGNKIYESSAYVRYVGKKQTGYDEVYLGSDIEAIDWSKTTYTLSFSRSVDQKYKNYAKKVSFKESSGTNNNNNPCIDIKAKTSYKGKGSIYIAYDVFYYNAAGNLVSISNYISTLSKYSKSSTISIPMAYNAASYKIKKRVILAEYK